MRKKGLIGNHSWLFDVPATLLLATVLNTEYLNGAAAMDKVASTLADIVFYVIVSVIHCLNVMCMIEPAAAAHDYLPDKNARTVREKFVLIFDYGVGTFAAFLLSFEEGVLMVEAIAGNIPLGENSFDNKRVSQRRAVKKMHKKACPSNHIAFTRLRTGCARAEGICSIAARTIVGMGSPYKGIHFNSIITSANFERLNKDFCKASMKLVEIEGTLEQHNFMKFAEYQQDKMACAGVISWCPILSTNMNREPTYVGMFETILRSVGHLVDKGLLHYHGILSRCMSVIFLFLNSSVGLLWGIGDGVPDLALATSAQAAIDLLRNMYSAGLLISFAGTRPSFDHILDAKECLHKAASAAAHIEQLTSVELKIYLFQSCYLFGRALAAVYSKMDQQANGFTGTIAPYCFTKPFRIFLRCTDSKCSCFEELVSILELMMVIRSYIQYQDIGFLILNCGQLLEHLKHRIIFQGTSQLSSFSLNRLQASSIFELAVLRIDRQWQYLNMSFLKNDRAKRVEPYFSKKNTIFDTGKMLCKVQGNIFLEWHKKVTMIERDYYGSSTERDSTCRDVIKSREQLMLLFPVLFILQSFEAYVGILLLEAGFINFTDDGQEFTLSLEETRKLYFINEGSIFHYDQMVADVALWHPRNALGPSGVVDVLIMKHEVAKFIIHRQLMKQGVTMVPTDFGISVTTILQNQTKTFVGYQLIDSNLEDKVLFDDGRNVTNVFKIEDPLRRMANYGILGG